MLFNSLDASILFLYSLDLNKMFALFFVWISFAIEIKKMKSFYVPLYLINSYNMNLIIF